MTSLLPPDCEPDVAPAPRTVSADVRYRVAARPDGRSGVRLHIDARPSAAPTSGAPTQRETIENLARIPRRRGVTLIDLVRTPARPAAIRVAFSEGDWVGSIHWFAGRQLDDLEAALKAFRAAEAAPATNAAPAAQAHAPSGADTKPKEEQ